MANLEVEDAVIAPVSSWNGDWLGFKEEVDVSDEDEIERVCEELETFLKEVSDT